MDGKPIQGISVLKPKMHLLVFVESLSRRARQRLECFSMDVAGLLDDFKAVSHREGMSLSSKLYYLFQSPSFRGSVQETASPLNSTSTPSPTFIEKGSKKKATPRSRVPRKKKHHCECCCSLPDLPSTSGNSFEKSTSQFKQQPITKEK